MATGKGKALVVVGLGVAGAAALAAMTGGTARAAEGEGAEPAKPQPKVKTSNRVALAKKYAKRYGVPASLVLATIAAQSGNKADAYRANKRGGAWGYGQMTLATAQEIYGKANTGLPWDKTGQGLLDPALNIALTAYYLGLWWKRYKRNPLGWILAAYAYVLGPGRVRKVLPNDAGKLPKPLPADFASLKKRYAAALTQADIKKAVAEESTKPTLGAGEYGKALSAKIPASTTGYQARAMFGQMTGWLSKAYATLKNYDPSGIAAASRIDAGSIKAAREYLDSTNQMLAKYYAQMPATNDALTADQLNKLKVAVSTSSVAVKTVDDLFGTSFWKELGTEIVQAGKEIVSKVNTGIGFSAGMIAAGAVGVGFLILAIKK
jgi:hypothetical protein